MEINSIKISDALGGRLDPHQFHFERMDMIHHIYATGQWCKLKDVIRNVKSVTTSLTNQDIYIGLENIASNTGEYVPTVEKESISSAAIFKKGDILFPKLRPYLNKVYRAEFAGKCSTEFHVFEARNINADFLTIILRSNIVVAQTKHLMTGNTLPRLQSVDIGNIIIPVLSDKAQEEIVEIYSQARNAKQAKDHEAAKLLAGTDSYLLDQLGVVNQKGQKCQQSFTTNIGSMIGRRFDVSFYKDRFEIKSPIYPNHKLSDVVVVNPSVKFKLLKNDDEISFVPMEAINEAFGEIAEKRTTTIAKTKGFTKFEEGDLLWAKITPCMQNGKSTIAYNLTNGVGCGSTEFYVLRPKDESVVSIEYIYNLLRHHSVLEAAKSSFGGSAGQQRVSSGYLKSILIPIPPIEVQRNIANAITEKKVKAKRLQQEGVARLAEAKNQIEKIILG